MIPKEFRKIYEADPNARIILDTTFGGMLYGLMVDIIKDGKEEQLQNALKHLWSYTTDYCQKNKISIRGCLVICYQMAFNIMHTLLEQQKTGLRRFDSS